MDLEFWANITGVIGFFITIIGFVWTGRIANAAREAANQARDKIIRFDAIAGLASAHAAIQESKRLHRIAAWDVALDRYGTARTLIVKIRALTGLLDNESQRKLTSVVTYLSAVEEDVESRSVDNPAQAVSVDKLNRALAKASDLITEVQAILDGTGQKNV